MKINFEIETKTAVQESKFRDIDGQYHGLFCSTFIVNRLKAKFGEREEFYNMDIDLEQSFKNGNVIHSFDIFIGNCSMEEFRLLFRECLVKAFKKAIE